MSAEQHVALAGHDRPIARQVLHVERVLERARRMVRRVVERGEVVVVELDLRSLRDLIAEPREHLDDLVDDLVQHVLPAERALPARKGDVDRLRGHPALERDAFEHGALLVERGLDRDAHLVGDAPDLGPLLGGERSQTSQHRGERALLAEVLEANRFERVERRCLARRGDRSGLDRAQIVRDGHASSPLPTPESKKEPLRPSVRKDGSGSRGTTLVGRLRRPARSRATPSGRRTGRASRPGCPISGAPAPLLRLVRPVQVAADGVNRGAAVRDPRSLWGPSLENGVDAPRISVIAWCAIGRKV